MGAPVRVCYYAVSTTSVANVRSQLQLERTKQKEQRPYWLLVGRQCVGAITAGKATQVTLAVIVRRRPSFLVHVLSVAAVLEDHGDKRKHHVILPKDSKLPLRVEFLRTRMELRSRADFSMVRECDGETMADGAECACARLADHGSPEYPPASA